MYSKFFGFKEKPFKLVPDPEYLFLSRSHEEALAHLSYAIDHGEGFVELTGEVGTGKTTLCRVFLENLDESVEAAYIFNPKLDALQLLKAINDELGLDSGADNTRDLIDTLNRFLIEKKAAGHKVIVLIDEAQNLSLEVLEQLRLLSNLETSREKLLQIILVGQPELGDLLASHTLRQLSQRINITCRLAPLTFQEARDYIRHRISLASHRAGPPFDRAAYRAIYEYSSGVPRLINIACDRVLLNAFSRNSFRITGVIAREGIRELKRDKHGQTSGGLRNRIGLAVLAAAVVLLIGAGLYLYNQQLPHIPDDAEPDVSSSAERNTQSEKSAATDNLAGKSGKAPGLEGEVVMAENSGKASSEPEEQTPALPLMEETVPPEVAVSQPDLPERGPDPLPEAGPVDAAENPFLNYLQGLNSRRSRNSAMAAVLKLWFPSEEISPLKNRLNVDRIFFQESAEQYGLLVQPVATESDITLIGSLKLPAIFTFYLAGRSWPKYLAVPYITDEKIYYFDPGRNRMSEIDRKSFLRYWSGEAYISWKDFNELKGMITERSSGEDILSLKKLLRDLGYNQVSLTEKYDSVTVSTIKDIQEKYSLHVDGLVGPFTKIVLYNESETFVKPSYDRFTALKMEIQP